MVVDIVVIPHSENYTCL